MPKPERPRTSCASKLSGSPRRDGIVLVAALICSMLSVLAVANIFTTVRLQRQQVTRRTVELQTAMLAHAGIQRAMVKLAATSTYTGETWQPQVPSNRPAKNAAETTTGRVQISVERNNNMIQLAVVAEYPFGAADQIRKSMTWAFPTATKTNESSSNSNGGRP